MTAPGTPPREPVVDRFLRYVRIDTQSKEDRTQVPSSPGQWDLVRILAEELRGLGAADVRVSDFCTVYARVPGNVAPDSGVPAVGFIAHVDTSPAVSGTNVRAIVHEDYRGGDIVLPEDTSQILTVRQNPALANLVGDDVITTDGTTLLGSDDKAGVAAIMTLVDVLLANPDLPHGPVSVAFTPDEEVGTGIGKFDIGTFGARYAYTVDGGGTGEINDETFSARLATVVFNGTSSHPGSAKGEMASAIRAIAHFLTLLPRDMLPETTEGRDGFVHPYAGTADSQQSEVKVLLRDFEEGGLDAKERLLGDLATATEEEFPGIRTELRVEEDYRNMKEILRNHPDLTENAREAARRAGVSPIMKPARGGTDGSKLTFRGLPCPNIFTGGHNFHGKLEFNSRRGLEKTTETLLHLVRIFAERATNG